MSPKNYPYKQDAIGTTWTWQYKQFFQAPGSPRTQKIFSPISVDKIKYFKKSQNPKNKWILFHQDNDLITEDSQVVQAWFSLGKCMLDLLLLYVSGCSFQESFFEKWA